MSKECITKGCKNKPITCFHCNFETIAQAKLDVLDDKDILHQFACLESWCKSRGKGIDYCRNCKVFNGIKERHGLSKELKGSGGGE